MHPDMHSSSACDASSRSRRLGFQLELFSYSPGISRPWWQNAPGPLEFCEYCRLVGSDGAVDDCNDYERWLDRLSAEPNTAMEEGGIAPLRDEYPFHLRSLEEADRWPSPGEDLE